MPEKFKDIRDLIEKSSEKFSKRVAFRLKQKISGKAVFKNITYREFKSDIDSLGKYLVKNNIVGKRIIIIGKNSYEWLLSYFGIICSGNIVVPIDTQLKEPELEGQIERSKADFIFYSSQHGSFFEKRKEKGICTDSEEYKNILKEGAESGNEEEYRKIEIDSEKPGIILFTSGTSADSKAVILSQKNIVENVYSLSHHVKFYETDVNMALLPLHHTFGMTQLVLFLSYGMCNVFCEGLRISKCLNDYGVTILVGVPRIIEEMHKTIIRKIESQNLIKKVNTGIKISNFLMKLHIDIRRKIFKQIIDALGGRLRLVIVGAATPKAEVLKWFNDIGILAINGYGLTEASPVLVAENDTHRKSGSIGIPMPYIDVKIDSPDENGIGEIIARGKNIMLGYMEDEKATEDALRGGWFHTGDMGYFDKDGYLFMTGRCKNLIVLKNGKNIFPEELESLINECEAVKECIVYSRKDSDELLSKIVYNKSFDGDYEKEIKEHIEKINKNLVYYKRITDYTITDKEMEKTTTLKIKRRKALD